MENLNLANKNPLPSILDGKFFKIISSTEDGKVKAQCVICQSMPTSGGQSGIIHGNFRPTSNFIHHLKRVHNSSFLEYEEYARSAEIQCKKQKQSTLNFPRHVDAGSAIRNKCKSLITNFIVETMQPLSIVEDESFRKLIKGLNSSAITPCVETIQNDIKKEYNLNVAALKSEISKITHVCLTADVWSSRRRSFLGVTVHWISPVKQSFSRKSATLALRRFKGKHSYDKIAETLHEVIKSYDIGNKIACVVSDNGSNFVKAFKVYGVAEPNDESDEENEDLDMSSNDIEFDKLEISLPRHVRCASHTLNLVATSGSDMNKIPNISGNLKRAMRGAFAKCTSMWNKSSRSVKIAESIKEVTGISLIRPVVTRWNSTFDAITQLLNLKSHLPQIFEAAEVEKLKLQEIEALEDYCKAMKPVAWALDKLQSETDFYYGYLAPTILATNVKLQNLIDSEPSNENISCFATFLKDDLCRRYENIVNLNISAAKYEFLAAVTMPMFKLRWLPSGCEDTMKKLLIQEAQKFMDKSSTPTDRQSLSDWEVLLKDTTQEEYKEDPHIEVLQYLQDPDSSLKTILKYPTILKIFLAYNTPLPSSAPVERLFSYAGMIFRPNRCNLSDDLFEMLFPKNV